MNIPFKQYWDILSGYLISQKSRFILLSVLLFGSIGLQIVNPQIMRSFIDSALDGDPVNQLLGAALLFMGIALFQQIVSVSARYLGEIVAWTATNDLRADLARHCLELDMSFHNDSSPGELIERIDGDVAELANFFSQLVVRILGNILLLLGIVIALLMEDWRLGLAFAVYSLITLFALNSVRGLAIPHQKAFRESTADLFGYIEERLAGTEDIRASGAVDFVIRGLYRLHYVMLTHWRKSWRMFIIVRFVAGMMLTLGTVMAALGGFYLFSRQLITLGTVYLIIHYVNLMRRPIREITHQIESLQNIGAAVERIKDLRAITSSILSGPGVEHLMPGPAALTFDSVSFSYIQEERVLNALSFNLQPGKVLGLLGRTGSGKTTLARLILRLYDPTGGSIRLNDIDIREHTLHNLRRRVAMVTQDVQLFQGTVRDNITLFDRSIEDEAIIRVIDELGLTGWFDSLANGLDTKIETGGRGLSAGEAQLLAFTRVFLRDPGLVILDEASSRLDPVTEQLIERAIDRLLKDRTAIVIAHRLGTVHRTQSIMILEKGDIVEHGERAQLANDPSSRFYGLLQTGMAEVLA